MTLAMTWRDTGRWNEEDEYAVDYACQIVIDIFYRYFFFYNTFI